VLKDKNLVLESGSSQRRLVLEEEKEDEVEVEVEVEKESVEHVKEIVVVEKPAATIEKRTVLRTGSEGEEVRKLQVRFPLLLIINNYTV